MAINSTRGNNTTMRVASSTKRALQMAVAEMTLVSGEPVRSDNEAVLRLIEFWKSGKAAGSALAGGLRYRASGREPGTVVLEE